MNGSTVENETEEYYEAANRAGRNLVILRPLGIWSDYDFETFEMAQSFALRMNNWLAIRPQPDDLQSFMVEPAFIDTSDSRLQSILINMVKPELMFSDASLNA